MSPSPCELVAIVSLIEWLPFGKTLSAIALGALLVMFLTLVLVALNEGRKRKRAREVDPKFLDQPPRRTDFLWEERYGGKDYE